jgi:hypothetical protein
MKRTRRAKKQLHSNRCLFCELFIRILNKIRMIHILMNDKISFGRLGALKDRVKHGVFGSVNFIS